MKGLLEKKESGWVINETLPIHPSQSKRLKPTKDGFFLDGALYKHEEKVDFDTLNVYVAPDSPDIHCNRGGEVVHAEITPGWEKIIEGFLKTYADPASEHPTFSDLTKYLEKKYFPPQRKKGI